MNIIIYALIIFGIIYFLLRFITNISSKKISKQLRKIIFFGSITLAILLGFGGKIQLNDTLNLEALYSNIVRGHNFQGLGNSFSVGLRALF